MFHTKIRPALVRQAVLTALAPLALASTAAADSDLLEEVLVTARSIEDTLPLELAHYGHDVEVVTAERLKSGGYVDVSSALQRETPGLYVSPRSGPFDYVDVSLQGSRPGDVLWLVDGVRINNRIFNDTTPDTLPAGMVERIEVLKGGESLFYGTQGVAGAINIVTRSFSDEPGGEVAVGADSNDGYHANAYGRGSVGGHKFVVYGSKDEGDGYEQYDRFQPSATDRKRGYDVSNIGLKYAYDFTDDLNIDLLYHHTDARLDNNSPARTRRSYNDRDEDIVSARLNYAATETVQFTVKGYLHDWDTTYANIQNHPVTGQQVVLFPPGTYWGFYDYGASALVKVTPSGPVEYHAGYDYQNYRGRDEVFPIAGKTERVNAIFAQVRSAKGALGGLNVAAGVRYNEATGGEDATVWNVSGRYEISPALYFEAMVGTSFLLPSAEQLYYLGELFDDYAGNPDLLPEQSRNLNLSVGGSIDLRPRPLTWQVTAFARDVDHLIDVSFDDPAYANGRYENVDGTVEVRGGELSLAAPIGTALRLSASYTYAQSHEEGTDLQLNFVPLSYAKAQVTFAPPARPFEVSAALNWVGDVYQTVSTFGRQNFGDYTVLDVAGQLFMGHERQHRIGVSLKNVFDEEFATRLQTAQQDNGSGPFLARRLGVPRTVQVTYTRTF